MLPARQPGDKLFERVTGTGNIDLLDELIRATGETFANLSVDVVEALGLRLRVKAFTVATIEVELHYVVVQSNEVKESSYAVCKSAEFADLCDITRGASPRPIRRMDF